MSSGSWRNNDPGTSEEAGRSIDASRLEQIFAETVARRPKHEYPMGLTTEEVAVLSRIRLQSITPRAAPMVRKGILVDSGLKRAGMSRRGRIVWALKSEFEEMQAAAAAEQSSFAQATATTRDAT